MLLEINIQSKEKELKYVDAEMKEEFKKQPRDAQYIDHLKDVKRLLQQDKESLIEAKQRLKEANLHDNLQALSLQGTPYFR